MQTPKSKPGSLEVVQRKSPATPRTARQLKTSVSDKSPTPRSSPKITNRHSPRSPLPEKKCPNRVSELESQLAQLRSQLGVAHRDAEQAKSELRAMAAKLEESEKHILELTNSEDDRIHELRRLSHERDKAWESELEAVHRKQSMESSALASAVAEIGKLKSQLERAAESEDLAHAELERLRSELSETLELVEECKGSEARAAESYEALASDYEQSKARVKSLEGLVGKLQAEVINGKSSDSDDPGPVQELRAELASVKSEVLQLRSALDAAEVQYQEEFIRSTLQIRTAYEQAERARAESALKEADLTSELNESKAWLIDKETELDKIRVMRSETEAESEKLKAEIEKVNEVLAGAEAELRRVKVQADQWRKAAEAAAAMLPETGPMGSPGWGEEMEDDECASPKRRNNVLKKFGVLWKKTPK